MDLETRYGHLLERHGNGALGRRGFLGRIAVMAIGCGLVVPGLARFAPAHAGQTVRYDGFGGYSQEAFDRLLSLRNDVGLLAEEYDPHARRQLGNFPQAFSHLALIGTALSLHDVGPAQQRGQGAKPAS